MRLTTGSNTFRFVDGMQYVKHSVQHFAPANELLRAEQVSQLLKVDRSTIYRMAESGRLPATKVGRQWRFPADAIARLLQTEHAPSAVNAGDRDALLEAVETSLPLIELSAQLLGVMMIATDMDGNPVTELINPNPWFTSRADEPDFVDTCLAYWKQLADDPAFDVGFRLGPLNVECARTFFRIGPRLAGMLYAGGIDPTGHDERSLYRLSAEGRARVLTYLPAVAAAVSRIASNLPAGVESRRIT